jgi:putative DNA primase/helicase
MSTPYRDAARSYFEAGWSPIPLPHEEKSPPPSKFNGKTQMFTGVGGVYVTEEHLKVWLGIKGRAQAGKLSFAPGNVALRLPPGVLGIDIDAYGEKKGAETLAAAEEEWGTLPPTWVSTSKDDGVSGIRLYRIPPGLKWPGQLPQGGGVELIRWDHRFMVVAPSIHDKTKMPYRWLREVEEVDLDGESIFKLVESEDEFPDAPPTAEEEAHAKHHAGLEPWELCSIPWLPEAWVEALTGGEEFSADAVDETLGDEQMEQWLEERNGPYDPCSHMRKMQTRWSVSVQKGADDGGAHDEMRDAIWGALNDAKAGHSGIIKVLSHLRNVFLEAVKDRRADEGAARSEWARAVLRGGKKVTADDNEPEEEDPCDAISKPDSRRFKGKEPSPGKKSGKPRSAVSQSASVDSSVGRGGSVGFDILGDPGPLGSDDVVYEFTQFGNADRLVRVMNGRARWVPGIESWMIWDGSRWVPDATGQVARWSTKAIRQIAEEAEFAGGSDRDEKDANAEKFRKWMLASSNVPQRDGAIRQARDRKGITVPFGGFDAQPSLLNLPNGTLSLGRESVEHWRVHRPGDLLTLRTEAAYVEGARSAQWQAFLERALPDPDVRSWVQKLAGVSLYGDNQPRLFIVIFGTTSTGKSTFTEALRGALGEYAATANLSMFRDNQDERPRPDLVRALSKRMVFCEEASSSWHLHPDQVKRLTGGTAITARMPHKGEYLERIPAFTPWLSTNSSPTIDGADLAFFRRLRVIPFNEVINEAEEVSDYGEALDTPEARTAILSWLVEGYRAYLEDKDTQQPPATWEARERFTSAVSDFDRFLADCCVLDPEEHCFSRDLYNAFVEWSEDRRVKNIPSETDFGKFLNGRGIERKSKKVDGKPVKPRIGIALRSDWRVSAG